MHSCSLHISYKIVSSRFVLVLIYGVEERRCAYAWCTRLCIFHTSSTLGNCSSRTMKLQIMVSFVFIWLWTFYSYPPARTDPFKVHYYDTLACQRCWHLSITSSIQNYLSFINHSLFIALLDWQNIREWSNNVDESSSNDEKELL